ncbi:hypothetical protein SESBI_38034 [Sesbania bispinosa]|nr:hypothetical protein SESBI_38034 [Sesbania bispinosa]
MRRRWKDRDEAEMMIDEHRSVRRGKNMLSEMTNSVHVQKGRTGFLVSETHLTRRRDGSRRGDEAGSRWPGRRKHTPTKAARRMEVGRRREAGGR